MKSAVKTDQADWQAIAGELASALRATMLRNPTVSSEDWGRAQAALGRYESARGAVPPALQEQKEA